MINIQTGGSSSNRYDNEHRGKSGLQKAMVPGNHWLKGRLSTVVQGKVQQKDTAVRRKVPVRVKWGGKSAPGLQQCRSLGKPHQQQDQIGAPSGRQCLPLLG